MAPERFPSPTPFQDVCTALLVTAYTSLSWKDTLSCQRTTTQLCWPLLKQVHAGGRGERFWRDEGRKQQEARLLRPGSPLLWGGCAAAERQSAPRVLAC